MKKQIYLLICLAAIGLTACNDDETITPEPPVVEQEDTAPSMSFTINHKVGEMDFEEGTAYTLPSGEKATLSRYAYLLGQFYLINEDNTKLKLQDAYALIEAHAGKTTFTIENVPMGNYKGIGFSVGLDSATNHGDPNQYGNDHPLSSLNNSLHWGWTGGYIFTAIEGKDLDANESIIFHLAGATNKTDFDLAVDFTQGEKGSDIVLEYDIAEMFENPEAFSFATDGRSTHSISGPVATKLFDNMIDVFTLKSVSPR